MNSQLLKLRQDINKLFDDARPSKLEETKLSLSTMILNKLGIKDSDIEYMCNKGQIDTLLNNIATSVTYKYIPIITSTNIKDIVLQSFEFLKNKEVDKCNIEMNEVFRFLKHKNTSSGIEIATLLDVATIINDMENIDSSMGKYVSQMKNIILNEFLDGNISDELVNNTELSSKIASYLGWKNLNASLPQVYESCCKNMTVVLE